MNYKIGDMALYSYEDNRPYVVIITHIHDINNYETLYSIEGSTSTLYPESTLLPLTPLVKALYGL